MCCRFGVGFTLYRQFGVSDFDDEGKDPAEKSQRKEPTKKSQFEVR